MRTKEPPPMSDLEHQPKEYYDSHGTQLPPLEVKSPSPDFGDDAQGARIREANRTVEKAKERRSKRNILIGAGSAAAALALVGGGLLLKGSGHDTAPKAEATASVPANPSEHAANKNLNKDSNTIDNYTMPAPAGYTGYELPAELLPNNLSKLSPEELTAVFKKQTTVQSPADFPAAFTVALDAESRIGCTKEQLPPSSVALDVWANSIADKYLPSIEQGMFGGSVDAFRKNMVFNLERCSAQNRMQEMNSTYNTNVPPYMNVNFLKDGTTSIANNADGTTTVEFVTNERDNFGNKALEGVTGVKVQNMNNSAKWTMTLTKDKQGLWSVKDPSGFRAE